jgi:folylpolyglutamate synthase/dihydrofolate synthase
VIDNSPIPSALYTRLRTQIESIDAQLGSRCSPFELLMAIALRAFEESQVNLVLLECGMGGRVDATNVVEWKWKVSAVLTTVDEDHMAFLGDTVEEIAKEKVGILNGDGEPSRSFCAGKGATKLILGRQRWRSVEDVVKTFASEKGVQVVDTLTLERPISLSSSTSNSNTAWQTHLPNLGLSLSEDSLPLAGDHQYDNLATALTILDHLPTSLALAPRLTKESIETGITKTKWRGRLERITLNVPLLPSEPSGSVSKDGPSASDGQKGSRRVKFLLDGAHNTSSALSLASYLALLPHPIPPRSHTDAKSSHATRSRRSQEPSRKFILSLSHSPPKTPHSTLAPILRRGDTVFLTPFSTPEGMPWVKHVNLEELEKVVKDLVGADKLKPAAHVVEKLPEWSGEEAKEAGIPDWQTEREEPPPHLTGVELCGDHLNSGQVFVCRNVDDAMRQAAQLVEEEWGEEGGEEELVVVSGSLYLVADALRYQEKLEGQSDSPAVELQREFISRNLRTWL